MPLGAIILSVVGVACGALAFLSSVKAAGNKPTPRFKELGIATVGMLFIVFAGVVIYFENQ